MVPPRDDADLFQPPQTMRAKVVMAPVQQGEDVFDAIDAAIARKADAFLGQACRDLEVMRSALHEAVTMPDRRAAALERVYGIAHDLEGQGASFGYALVTGLAALLCRFLKARRANDSLDLRIAKAHVEALAIVLDHRIAGDGGKTGNAMLDRLERLVGTSRL